MLAIHPLQLLKVEVPDLSRGNNLADISYVVLKRLGLNEGLARPRRKERHP